MKDKQGLVADKCISRISAKGVTYTHIVSKEERFRAHTESEIYN